MGDCIFHMAPMESADLCWCSGQSILCGKMSIEILSWLPDSSASPNSPSASVTTPDERGTTWKLLPKTVYQINWEVNKWCRERTDSMLDWDNNLKPYGTSRTVEVAMGKKSVSNLKDTKTVWWQRDKGSMFWNFLLQYSNTLYYKASSTSWQSDFFCNWHYQSAYPFGNQS